MVFRIYLYYLYTYYISSHKLNQSFSVVFRDRKYKMPSLVISRYWLDLSPPYRFAHARGRGVTCVHVDAGKLQHVY